MVTAERPANWDPSHPAPGKLELIRQFANTVDLYRGRDLLTDVDQAEASLRRLGLLADAERLGEADLERVRSVRAAMRSIFVDDEPVKRPSLPTLQFRIVLDGVRRVHVEASDAGLWGRLTDLSVELLVADRTGQLSRLKACANPQCRWLFWDASRPGTGRWCSMQVCGGQHKARTYRARNRRST